MIDMDKEYKTRDGRKVRVLCIDRDSEMYPVVALIGKDALYTFTPEGRDYSGEVCDLDLIEVKPRINLTKYMNVYTADITSLFDSRVAADRHKEDRLACVKVEIDCEEGEGLDEPVSTDDIPS